MQVNDSHTVTIIDFPINKVTSMSLTNYSLTINANDNNNDHTIKINVNHNNDTLKVLLYKWVLEDVTSNNENSYAYLYNDESRQTIMRRIKDALNEIMELDEEAPF